MERHLPYLSRQRRSGTRRWWLAGLVGVVVAIAALLAGAWLAFGSPEPRLTGTSIGKDPAPGFRLRDAGGRAYSLGQLRGREVVLTFMYTHCQESCPLTAELLRHADEAAGHPADVTYVAVSVDPIGDTPESLAQFETEHHLSELGDRWHYLIGSQPELEAVWRSYYIYAPAQPVDPLAPDHSSVLYLIDKHGRGRLVSDTQITAEDLARDLLILRKQ